MRARRVGGASAATSSPAPAAMRRHGWQWATWRARRRESRTPTAPAPRGRDDRLDAQAARAGDELVVLLGQALARPEQGALDGRARQAEAVADLAVGKTLELAQDEDLVMHVRQAAERAAQARDVLLGSDGLDGSGAGADELAVVVGRQAFVGVVGDLLGTPAAAERVDARVLGDLVDPRLEGDRPLGLAHAPQGGDEDLLGDVLGAAVVLDHAVDVGGDPPLVAAVERLERAVVPAAYPRDQLLVRRTVDRRRFDGLEQSPTLHPGFPAVSTRAPLPAQALAPS